MVNVAIIGDNLHRPLSQGRSHTQRVEFLVAAF
jgi:hypothetical protein